MPKQTQLEIDQAAEIERLKGLLHKPPAKLSLRVSEKGAVSIYGLCRFPVTLYQEPMLRLLDHTEAIREFIAANGHLLKKKEV